MRDDQLVDNKTVIPGSNKKTSLLADDYQNDIKAESFDENKLNKSKIDNKSIKMSQNNSGMQSTDSED